MTHYVRVRDTSGHEITVDADLPEGHPRGIQPGQEVLEKAATRGYDPLPPKYRTRLGEPIPGGRVARRREREQSAKKAPKKPVPTAAPQSEATDGHPLAETEQE